jgi:glutathione synthase/RimK-type ligase-like ATP-grasp enzyme
MHLALATYAALPELAADDALLVPELARAGIAARPAVWDDPAVRWGDFDAVVIRSCWDYHRKPVAFQAWIRRLEAFGVRVLNAPEMLRWNADKRYLRDLASRGVPTVPTRWVDCGGRASLADILAGEGWREVVVKPAVSASAEQTWRVSTTEVDDLQPRFSALAARGHVLVQPFIEEIRVVGEWSLVFFDGAFSHAVLKRPGDGDFRVQSAHGGRHEVATPSASLVAAAGEALAAAPAPCTYARVDGCVVGGVFRLMELELLEPSLYLESHPEAPRRFAAAIVRALGDASAGSSSAEPSFPATP